MITPYESVENETKRQRYANLDGGYARISNTGLGFENAAAAFIFFLWIAASDVCKSVLAQ
jgi:hypothetical protein